MELESYEAQRARWPSQGRHVLARYDAESVVVYQAYKPSITAHAVAHQGFGGDFRFSRMSWIKPNFLWMMYRSGWATKEHQERVLALRLKRAYFDRLLEVAVASNARAFQGDTSAWKEAVKASDVRFQWDPDHDPGGAPVQRRAIQLGLRGEALAPFRGDASLSIEDITPFVHEAAHHRADPSALVLPLERVYAASDAARQNLRIDATNDAG